MNATLQAWDTAVKAWWTWQAAMHETTVRLIKETLCPGGPWTNTATKEGVAYIDALLDVPKHWKSPTSVACGS